MTPPLGDNSSSVPISSLEPFELAKGGRIEPFIDDTSIISDNPPAGDHRPGDETPNSPYLDDRLGARTLSSLALPIFVFGSSCSLNMLNLADIFGINKLVLKSSVEGSACARSKSGLDSTCRPLLHLRD